MAKELSPCTDCKVLKKFNDETREVYFDAAGHLVPVVGEDVIEASWESEATFIDALNDGVAECPGYAKINKLLARAVLFFDGDSGLEFAESGACHNPAMKNGALDELKAKRGELDAAFEVAFRNSQ